MLNLGKDFDDAVLTAVGIDPTTRSPAPSRSTPSPRPPRHHPYTAVTSAPAAAIRELICQAADVPTGDDDGD